MKAGAEVKDYLALGSQECQTQVRTLIPGGGIQSDERHADKEPPAMRTIGFRSNVLFIIAAAAGLLAALGRPWYARSPVQTAEEAPRNRCGCLGMRGLRIHRQLGVALDRMRDRRARPPRS